jgi:hypothetical protein
MQEPAPAHGGDRVHGPWPWAGGAVAAGDGGADGGAAEAAGGHSRPPAQPRERGGWQGTSESEGSEKPKESERAIARERELASYGD